MAQLGGMLGLATTAAHGYMNYKSQRIQYDMEVAARDQKEFLSGIAASVNYNNVSDAEVETGDAFARLGNTLQIRSMSDKAKAENNAAAAGVAGGSVQQTMFDLERSAISANHVRIRNYESALDTHTATRKSIALNKAFNRDTSVLIPPSATMAMLATGAQMIDQIDRQTPEGQKRRELSVFSSGGATSQVGGLSWFNKLSGG